MYIYIYIHICVYTYVNVYICSLILAAALDAGWYLPSNPNPQSTPQTLNPKPQTPNPKPQTPNPKPQTPFIVVGRGKLGT